MFQKIARNFRKPSGFWGSVILKRMNKGHERVTKWALAIIAPKRDERILDIGCGGGNAVRLMAQKSDRVYGVDYSGLSVQKAQKLNKHGIAAGRVSILQASVDSLPFDHATFELATAFETVYFWPDWEADFKEVYRVLKPSGRFAIICEMARDDEKNKELEQSIGMKVPRAEELETLLARAGFEQIQTHLQQGAEEQDLCIIAYKNAKA